MAKQVKPQVVMRTEQSRITSMIQTVGIDHIAILVRDVSASAKWYQDVLGLKRFHEEVWGDFPAIVGVGTTSIALFPVQSEQPKPRPDLNTIAMRHFAFRVNRSNFESAKQSLAARGIRFTEQHHDIAESIYFFDPDGHEIEVTTYVMKTNREPLFVRPGEGRAFEAGLSCRINSASTAGEYCAFEVAAPPGEGVPLHVHSRENEVYYILEGQFEIQCGQRQFKAEAGAMVVLPRGIPHAFRNSSDTPSRALTVFIPGGFDDFVAELQGIPPEDAADEKKRDTIRRKYGIEFVRPGSDKPGAAPEHHGR